MRIELHKISPENHEEVRALAARPEQIRISTLPENVIALGLYKGMGFVAHGMEEGEVALYRTADSAIANR